MISSCIYEFIYIICFIIFFLTFGQLRFFKNLSVFERCLLLKSILKRAALFGTNCFVHYSRHFRYLGYLLSGVFIFISLFLIFYGKVAQLIVVPGFLLVLNHLKLQLVFSLLFNCFDLLFKCFTDWRICRLSLFYYST